jgi:hypothetical protein
MWQQFNFYLSENALRLYPNSEYFDKLFHFKKSLLPILDKYCVEDFLILDEGKYFLLRVEVSDETANKMKEDFDGLVYGNSDFDKVVPTTWEPENDARTRILGARERAIQGLRISFEGIPEGGWKIETWCEGRWIAKPDDLSLKTEKFAKFMSKVVGKFTRAYLEEIPERVDDRWLLSVFIHLFLHSVSEQRFERETRAFPWI